MKSISRSFLATALYVASMAPCLAQQEDLLEVMRLRLEQRLLQELNNQEDALEARISSELAGHREYLQQLDDKFYERAKFWVPVASGAIVALLALFLWQVGKTQKEAFETAQLTAVSKATELAQAKVNEIIVPERIVRAVEELSESTIAQIGALKENLISEVERELKSARNEVLENKHEAIEKALDEAIKTKFAKELDVLKRLAHLEKELSSLSQRFERVEDLVKVESIKQSLTKTVGGVMELPSTLKLIRWMAENSAKLILRI